MFVNRTMPPLSLFFHSQQVPHKNAFIQSVLGCEQNGHKNSFLFEYMNKSNKSLCYSPRDTESNPLNRQQQSQPVWLSLSFCAVKKCRTLVIGVWNMCVPLRVKSHKKKLFFLLETFYSLQCPVLNPFFTVVITIPWLVHCKASWKGASLS